MNVKSFLQACVNNGVTAVSTKDVATALRLSHNKTYKELKQLGTDIIWNVTKGSKSFWVIELPSNLPLCYEALVEVECQPVEDEDFSIATMRSMEHNHTWLTTRPSELVDMTM